MIHKAQPQIGPKLLNFSLHSFHFIANNRDQGEPKTPSIEEENSNRSFTAPMTFGNRVGCSTFSSRLSRMSVELKFKTDLIRSVIFHRNQLGHKIIFFLKHFVFPHFIAIVFGFGISTLDLYFPVNCFFPPKCSCNDLSLKIISAIKEYILSWTIWYLPFLINSDFTKSTRLIVTLLASTLIFCYYLLMKNETNFPRYPIHILNIVLGVLVYFNLFRGYPLKTRLGLAIKGNALFFVMFSNYLFKYYFAVIKNQLGNISSIIIYNLFILIFLFALQKCLLIYGRFLCSDSSILSKHNKMFVILSRISISYFIAFLSQPFLNLSESDFFEYGCIISYLNSLIALYTRKNLLLDFITHLAQKCLKKLHINLQFKPDEELDIYLSKKVSGTTLDVAFVSNTSFIAFYFWKRTITNSNCKAYIIEDSPLFGMILFTAMNLLMTLGIFAYMKFKNFKILSYPIWQTPMLNVWVLLCCQNFFENTLSDIEKMMTD